MLRNLFKKKEKKEEPDMDLIRCEKEIKELKNENANLLNALKLDVDKVLAKISKFDQESVYYVVAEDKEEARQIVTSLNRVMMSIRESGSRAWPQWTLPPIFVTDAKIENISEEKLNELCGARKKKEIKKT